MTTCSNLVRAIEKVQLVCYGIILGVTIEPSIIFGFDCCCFVVSNNILAVFYFCMSILLLIPFILS